MKHDALIAPDESQFAFTRKISGFTPNDGQTDAITVPDAHLLFSGDFKRSGDDLKIVGDDGKAFLVSDYFKNDKRPTLLSPEGASLTGDVVDLLAGPLAPGQYAQATPQPGAAEAVGRVAVVTGNVTVIRNGVAITVNAGDAILKNDVVQTGAGSTLGLTFNDGSTFNLAAGARLAINEFVYDPNGAANSSLVTLIQGAATFVAGQVAKTGDMKVATPVATMGIRGTAVTLDLNALDGRVTISVIDERDNKDHIVQVFDRNNNLIATATSTGGRLVLTPTTTFDVIASFTNKTTEQIALEFAAFQAVLSSYDAAKQFFPNLPDRADVSPKGTQTAQGSGGPQPPGTGTTPPDSVTQASTLPEVVFTKAVESPGTGDGPNGPDDGTPEPIEIVITPPALNPITGSGIINGTDGADYITGSDTPDTINAMGGNDFVFAMGDDDTIIAGHGGGDDYYDGGTNGEDGDTIRFESTTLGVTIDLNVVEGVLTATADGAEIGHDDIVNVENFVGGSGNDLFILHTGTHWTLDGGDGFDTVKVVNGVDFTGEGEEEDGPDVYNIEMVDLDDGEINVVDFDGAGVDDFNEAGVVRVIGNDGDVINLGDDDGDQNGHWVLVGSPQIDTAGDEGLFSDDHHTDGVAFQRYDFVEDGQVTSTAYIDADILVNVVGELAAQDDSAGMTENQVLFVDALANDSDGGSSPTTLTSLGIISIDGPENITLGLPAIVIENNQIRITPGTAFDALADGETATITIPYTMQNGDGETATAVATVTVTGTNDGPSFSTFPQGFEAIGSVDDDSDFGGTPAVRLITNGANSSQIETFLGLSAGALVLISQQDTQPEALQNPTNGAAIAFDLELAAGETVTFTWNFASSEYEPFADFAFFSFKPALAPAFGDKLADIFAIGDSINDGVLHSSGWQQYSFTAEDAGLHRLGIGVVNTGDTLFDSFLYLSGFTGLGFARQTTEDGTVETFDLLNGAFDVDTNDVLVAINIDGVAHNQDGEPVDVTGAIQVVANTVTIDPTFFDYLADGESVTVTVNYDVSDGHTVTHNSATLVVNGENDAPVAEPAGFDPGPINAPVGTPGVPFVLANNFSFTDVDAGDAHTVSAALNTDDSSVASSLGTFSFEELADTTNGTGGLVHWEYSVDPALVNALAPGTLRIEVYDVTVGDGHGGIATHQVTITINGQDEVIGDNQPPLIETDALTVSDADNPQTPFDAKVLGLSVSDIDAADTLQITAIAGHGSLAFADGSFLDGNDAADTLSFQGSQQEINAALAGGVVYSPTGGQYSGYADTDMVTLTVEDQHGAKDTVNFIFNVGGENDMTFEGTSGKDIIFSTGQNDTFTGNGNRDTFAFSFAESQIGDDIITDFHIGDPQGFDADMDKILFDAAPPEFASFEDLDIDYVDGTATINLGDEGTIVLTNIGDQQLHASNFIFHADLVT